MTLSPKGSYALMYYNLLRSFLILLSIVLFPSLGATQGMEDMSGLPTNFATFYQDRNWTGTDGTLWMANSARTDRILNGKAICFGTSGDRRITSSSYTGGIGI